MPVCRTNPTSDCALPTELHDTPYICIALPKPSELFCPCWASFSLQLCLNVFVHYVAIASQPFSLQFSQLPSDLHYYLSLCSIEHRPTRERLDSELTSSPPAVLTDWLPSLSTPSALRSLSLPFQLMALHDPFGLLATTLAIVYSVYSAYLPGLHAARPSAFVEGGGLEPPAHPKLFGESPPRGRTAVAFISVGVRGLNHSPYSNLAGLHPYSGFSFLCSVCRYTVATLTLTASCWSSLTTLHLSFIISPDAIILCILCFG